MIGSEDIICYITLSECECIRLTDKDVKDYLEDFNRPPITIPIDNEGNTKEVNPFKCRLFFQTKCNVSGKIHVYFLHPEFIEKRENVNGDIILETSLCDSCYSSIKKGKISDMSLAKGVQFEDFNRIGLETPTLFERIAIARVRLYMCVVKMKYESYDVSSKKCNDSRATRVLKGHAVAFDHDAPEVVSNIFSEDGLRKILNVVLIGKDDKIDHLAKDAFGSYSLTGRAYVLYQWIACLKVINKYYKDIFLPPFEDVKRIVECTMKKVILDDSLKTTNPITIGIENSIGDDVAKVRTNNSNELSVALNYSKNDTTEKNIIKNENTDIDSNDLFQEEVSYSISQSMVTSRIKQKNDGHDLERSILKSALNALDVNIDKSKDDKLGGKMSDINESRRSNTPINEFLSIDFILSGGFPHVFMTGQFYDIIQGSFTIKQRQHLLNQYNNIPAQCIELLFYLLNQGLRHEHTRNVCAAVRTHSNAFKKFSVLTNSHDFQEKLKKSTKDPKSDDAKYVLNKVMSVL